MNYYNIPAGSLPPGSTVRCGNRHDLPKKQRVHFWLTLGLDGRNYNGAYTEGEVRACAKCGADQFRRDKKTRIDLNDEWEPKTP